MDPLEMTSSAADKEETTMPDSVLLAYATSYGSTQEVADAVAAALRDQGLAVDVRPMREVATLEGYSAAVLGAPLYMFRWHKDARRFLSRHGGALGKLATAVFALGPFHEDEKEFREAREQLDKELARHPGFTPAAVAVFGGTFDPAKLRFPFALVPALKQMPANDIRDWSAIREWAAALPEKLRPSS